MISEYEAVFLDFDGTIADTGEGIFNSIRYAVKELGFDPLPESILPTFIGPPVFSSFKRTLGADDETCRLAVEKYRENYRISGIYQLEMYDGIKDLIKDMKKSGIKVAVASSKPENFVMRVLDYLELSDFIDFISAPESDRAPESKTALVERAVSFFNASKSKAIMVGDRYFDIEGANGAGIDSIGVTFGYGSKEELENSNATFIANSVAEVRNIIFS